MSDAKPASRPQVASLVDVGVRAGDRWLLRGVTLALHVGEIVTLIGPNGAGKTTLVKALLGIVPLTTGHVNRPKAALIGYVPQRLSLDPVLPLTVRRLVSPSPKTPRDEIEAVLGETGVEARIDDPVGSLSGGEFQRVLLARALLRQPRLLVLDEPAQGVDYRGESLLSDLLARLRRERGVSILMVSHNLHVVMAATDRVVCMNGHICCSGTPHAVSTLPAFHDLFGPRSEALAVYSHHHDHGHYADGRCRALQEKETP